MGNQLAPTFFSPEPTTGLSRRLLLDAFWNGELQNELQGRNATEEYAITAVTSREDIMKAVENKRRDEIYPHPPENCNTDCQQKGNLILMHQKLMNVFKGTLYFHESKESPSFTPRQICQSMYSTQLLQ